MPGSPSESYFARGRELIEIVEGLDGCSTSAVTAAPWWCAGIETFPSSRGLVVERDGEPVAVVPLVQPGRLRPWLEPVGASAFGEPVGAMVRDAEARESLAEAAARRRLPLFLARIPADDPFVDALRRAYRRRGIVRVRPTSGTPVLELAGLTSAESLLSSSRRHSLRRTQRRAEELGEVVYEVHEPGPEQVADLFALVVEVEARSWKGESGKALARRPELHAFYERYAQRAARAGILRIAVLRIEGTPAAVQMHAESHSALNQLRIGYDERFARFAPGQLLTRHIIDWAGERGLDRFEILGVEEEWSMRWASHARPHLRVMTFGPGARSAAALAARGVDAARYRLRRRSAANNGARSPGST